MSIKELIIAYYTISLKELVRIVRIWPQTLIPPLITTSLYFVIFGKMIGSQIRYIEGVSYIDYIAPGLVIMSVIMNSFNNTVSSFFSAKFQKSIEELLYSPTPNSIIIIGFATGGIIRGIINGFLVLCITLYFTDIHVHSILIMAYMVIITSLFFSIIGIINAIYAKNFDDISWFPSFILTPLVYLGGVFYSIDMVSVTWKKVLLFNPMVYFVDIFRYSILDIRHFNCYIVLTIITVLSVIVFFLALIAFEKKLKN